MTPKQKAKELVHRFYNNAESRNKIGTYDDDMHINNCKQCALIAVDEILSIIWINLDDEVDYWAEVKKEIEKI